jgi:hypothetical protein
MEETNSDIDGRGALDNGGTYQQTTAADWQSIFVACWNTKVNGKLKQGTIQDIASQLGFECKTVSRQWNTMAASMPTLLSNHPDEKNEADVINRSHHILFQPAHSSRHGGKYKHDHLTNAGRIICLLGIVIMSPAVNLFCIQRMHMSPIKSDGGMFVTVPDITSE